MENKINYVKHDGKIWQQRITEIEVKLEDYETALSSWDKELDERKKALETDIATMKALKDVS